MRKMSRSICRARWSGSFDNDEDLNRYVDKYWQLHIFEAKSALATYLQYQIDSEFQHSFKLLKSLRGKKEIQKIDEDENEAICYNSKRQIYD